MKHVVIGTAGHIDHGKSALVRALTGTDPDRLKEEKARGITIDLGFAHYQVSETNFAFVDVPGHERFVKNMLAGASGIDCVLLVIAADESVMPQTREHFDICRLLHVAGGVVALTKVDLVDAETVELVRLEARELIGGSFLEGAPVVPVSANTEVGLPELRTALAGAARDVLGRSETGPARLPIDRAFSVKGFGTVVTGTQVSGRIGVDSELVVLPSNRRVKVRGVQVHGRKQPFVGAGQRARGEPRRDRSDRGESGRYAGHTGMLQDDPPVRRGDRVTLERASAPSWRARPVSSGNERSTRTGRRGRIGAATEPSTGRSTQRRRGRNDGDPTGCQGRMFGFGWSGRPCSHVETGTSCGHIHHRSRLLVALCSIRSRLAAASGPAPPGRASNVSMM